MARILDLDELPHVPHSHEFVGADHGNVRSRSSLSTWQPIGTKLHRHPYAEDVSAEWRARRHFRSEWSDWSSWLATLSSALQGEAHGFVDGGTGELRLIAIHAAGRFNTEWLAGPGSGLVLQAEQLAGAPSAAAVAPQSFSLSLSGWALRDRAGCGRLRVAAPSSPFTLSLRSWRIEDPKVVHTG